MDVFCLGIADITIAIGLAEHWPAWSLLLAIKGFINILRFGWA